MPRKTKKAKLAAIQRKHISVKAPAPPQHTTSPALKPIDNPPIEQTKNQHLLSAEDQIERHYFFHDLRKSLILVTFVFTLEFLLYYATMNNYLKIIKF